MANLISCQVVAYGLNSAQRGQAATLVNNWLSNKTKNYINVDPNYTQRGETFFFAEVDGLATKTDGDDLFETVRVWLSTRASDSPVTGAHSYVRLAEQNASENDVSYAESPGWVTTNL